MYLDVHIYIYMYVYVYIYVCMYIYIYIYIKSQCIWCISLILIVYFTIADLTSFFFRFLSGHDRSFLYGQVIFEREILFTEHNYVIMSRYTVHHKFTGHFKQ